MLLDRELARVTGHFNDELGFLKDRLEGVQEELTTIDAEEDRDTYSGTVTQEPASGSSQEDGASSTIVTGNRGTDTRTIRRILTADSSVDDVGQRKELELRHKARASHRQRLARAVLSIWDTADRLEGFVQLNTVALYKILKKRDKVLALNRLNIDLVEKKRVLSLLIIPASFKERLKHQYRDACPTEAAATEDVEDMAAIVQKHFMTTQVTTGGTQWISFFLGACTVAFLDLLVATILPPTNPHYALGSILVLLPIFRLALIAPLMFWGGGTAISCFETYGVNYKFILSIDPKCRVSSKTLFSVAQILSVFWIIGFGGFVVDAKFGLLLSPRWYWTYAGAVILSNLIVFVVPSRTFRICYRKNILMAVFAAIRSGLTPGRRVTLVDNILGDVLTSLPKPLLDLQYTLVFFGGLDFLDSSAKFTGLPSQIERVLLPLITIFPYWIRLMQCCSRFQQEPDRRRVHAGNMGKYCSTMFVILTSNIPWERFGLSIYASRLLFVFVYIFASLYNLIWDVVFDWGLLPDPDHFVRPDHRILYPQWIYYFITVFNTVGRLTWALTLVPIAVIEDYRLNIAVIIYVISALEVLRRSAWIVLRLENEHLTNSSRYRAMLWVPKMTEPTDSPREQHTPLFSGGAASNQTGSHAAGATRKQPTIALAHAPIVRREIATSGLPHIPEHRDRSS